MSFASSLAEESNLSQRQNKYFKKRYFQAENPERGKKEKWKAQPGRDSVVNVLLSCLFSAYFIKHSSAPVVKGVSDGIKVSNQQTLTYTDSSRVTSDSI